MGNGKVMKIKNSELEEKLGYSIKQNFVSTGWDTATRVGYCLIKNTKNHSKFYWTYIHF